MSLCIEKRVGEREAKREIKVTADEFRRRQERGTDEVTAEQGSRLRDNKRSNDDLEDGEFNFQSCVRYPKPPNSINSTILFTYFIVTHRNAR